MVKEKRKPARLSDFDFWNALSRNEIYRQDRKYYNRSPLDQFGVNRDRYERIAQAMDSLGDAVLVHPNKFPEILKKVKACGSLGPRPVATLRCYHQKDRLTTIRDGHLILVEIDLTAPKNRIEKEVWKLVREMRESPKFSSSSMRRSLEVEPNEDIWRVYDAHKGGKPISALARERLRGRFPDSPQNVARLFSAEDKKLRRYVKKAKFMIHQAYHRT